MGGRGTSRTTDSRRIPRRFRDFGYWVLDQRELDGRHVENERNRFRKHLATAAFAGRAIGAVSRSDIAAWLRELSRTRTDDRRATRTLSTSSIRRCLSLCSTIFEEAGPQGLRLIGDNPCRGLRVRAQGRTTQESGWTALTLQEQQAIASCEAIPESDRLSILFAMGTGLNRSEQFNLRIEDVHLDEHPPFVFVKFGAHKRAPARTGARRVPLFGVALAAIRRWMELVPSSREANPHRLVFPSPRGERRQKPLGNGWPEIVDGKQRWVDPFKDALATAGVTRNVRWEDLRHTCGLSLIRGLWGPTWSLVEVRDMLGLSSIRGVERYTRQPTDTDPSPTLGAIAAIRTFCDNMAAQLDLLAESENRQAAGLVFEQLLNQWFAFAGLHPREPFRVRGEQIDGSFVLDHEVYLLEAKWEKDASPAKDLYAFREKIIGKSAHTRGVFITIKGITTEADTAIRTGKQLHFFVVVGAELRRLLRDGASLAEFLRDRQRLLAEQGLLLSKSSETSSASSRR